MNEIIIEGTVLLGDNAEIYIGDDIENINSLRNILIDKLTKMFKVDIDEYADSLYIENAYVSLFVADKKMSFEKMKESKVLEDLGLNFEIDYYGWSEWTIDYLYIDELRVGNHNLIDILRNFERKYIALVIQQVK